MEEGNPFVVRDEYTCRVGFPVVELWNQPHVPPGEDSELKKADEVRLFEVQEQMTRRLVEQPDIPVALTQLVVQVPVLGAPPQAKLRNPQQALGARLQATTDETREP